MAGWQWLKTSGSPLSREAMRVIRSSVSSKPRTGMATPLFWVAVCVFLLQWMCGSGRGGEVGAQAGLLPGGELGELSLDHGPDCAERVCSEHQQSGRLGGLDGGEDRAGGPGRVAGLSTVRGVVLLAALARGLGVVVDHRR